MSSISSVTSSSYTDYGQYASGKKIESAADGAAELTIIEEEDTQVRGYEVGADNISSAQSMLNVSDGALSGIADYLQRIRELAVQASNSALMTDSDLASIQSEIDQLKQGISDIASNTSYNTKNLLDGSNSSMDIMTDASGNSITIQNVNATLEALGIADFDVTGDFDISDIDDALDLVNSARSSVGAQSNALDYAYSYNTSAAFYTTASKSSLEDLDYPEAISEQKKQQTLEEYMLYMQKKQQEDEQNKMQNLFA